jgi:hypothetical protein
MNQGSGAWFLVIATEGGDLVPQVGRPGVVATGQGNGQGELEFLELMLTGIGTTNLPRAMGAGGRRR